MLTAWSRPEAGWGHSCLETGASDCSQWRRESGEGGLLIIPSQFTGLSWSPALLWHWLWCGNVPINLRVVHKILFMSLGWKCWSGNIEEHGEVKTHGDDNDDPQLFAVGDNALLSNLLDSAQHTSWSQQGAKWKCYCHRGRWRQLQVNFMCGIKSKILLLNIITFDSLFIIQMKIWRTVLGFRYPPFDPNMFLRIHQWILPTLTNIPEKSKHSFITGHL